MKLSPLFAALYFVMGSMSADAQAATVWSCRFAGGAASSLSEQFILKMNGLRLESGKILEQPYNENFGEPSSSGVWVDLFGQENERRFMPFEQVEVSPRRRGRLIFLGLLAQAKMGNDREEWTFVLDPVRKRVILKTQSWVDGYSGSTKSQTEYRCELN
jgi:hypothetical protein